MTQTAEHNKTEMTDYFKTANDNFKSALDAGIQFQQDCFKNMTEMFGRGETTDDVRHRVETVATDTINLVRKNVEQSQRMFDDGCKSGVEMLKKSFEQFQNGNGKDKDAFTQTRDVWQNAVDAMRSNVETAARTTSQAIENWSSFFAKTVSFDKKTSK